MACVLLTGAQILDMDLIVGPLHPEKFGIVTDYFHGASREFLENLGVDPTRLPPPDQWLETFSIDSQRAPEVRKFYFLLWTLEGRTVGFSSISNIKYGVDARKHLHVIEPDIRRSGIGQCGVRKSLPIYFEAFHLKHLFCEPNAFNVAPNRALRRAGFSYVKTYQTVPSPINFHQPVTQWIIEHSTLDK